MRALMITAALCFLMMPGMSPAASPCTPTPALGSGTNYPGASNVIPNGDLKSPAGKAVDAPGQKLEIIGTIRDQNCVPVVGAIIEIWQTDAYGQFRLTTEGQRATPDPLFVATGKAVSDNQGRYRFSTIFPGPLKGQAPRIFFRVSHQDFSTLNTTMFFADDSRNAKDGTYRKLGAATKALVSAHVGGDGSALGTQFNITLRGENKFKRF